MIPPVLIGFVVVGLLWIALLLWRFPAQTAMSVLAAVVVLDSLGITLLEINIGASIYQDDVACAALIAGAAILVARNRTLARELCTPALILLGLIAVNFTRGALLFGLKPAGNGVRTLFFLIV